MKRARAIRNRTSGVVAAIALTVSGLVGLGSAPPAGAAVPPADAGGFTGVTPVRLLDTRNTPAGPTGAASGCVIGTRTLRVVGTGSPAPLDAAAVALNVTVAGPSVPGFVTVWPGGASQPTASSLNYVTGQVVPNNVIVKVGALGVVNLFASGGCPHLIVDIVGYFATGTPAKGGITGINPERLLDTRSPGQGPCVNGVRDVQVAGKAFSAVPANAAAVALNVTVVAPTLPGFLTVYPRGVTRPTASTLNYVAGQVVPNGTVVKVGTSGQISLYANAGCPNVIVDVVGYFAPGDPTAAGGFFGVNPFRLLDSRSAGQVPCIAGTRTYHLTVAGVDGSAVPSEARAVALNVTVTNPTVPGYITVFPTGDAKPTASNLNYVVGQTVPNGVLVKVGTDQSVDLFASGGCPDLIVDVVGGFATTPIPLVDGCNVADALATDCSFFAQTSVAPTGTDIGEAIDGQAVSADGRYVAFAAGTTSQIFRRDLVTGETRIVSHGPTGALGDDASYDPAISADGRYIVFVSDATNLDPLGREKMSFYTEAYRWDANTDTLARFEYDPTRVGNEEPNDDALTPSISADGDRVLIVSPADNLAPVDNPSLLGEALVYTFSTNTWVDASREPLALGIPYGVESAVISGNGRFVAFTTDDPNAQTYDLNDVSDVYRRDLSLNVTEWVSRKQTGTGTGLSANLGAGEQSISFDGRYVAFSSRSTEFDSFPGDVEPSATAAGTTDIFVRDMTTVSAGHITRATVSTSGDPLNADSASPIMSSDARYVGYVTDATNAVDGDTNGVSDVVVRDRQRGVNHRGSLGPGLVQLTTDVHSPVISGDGTYVGFTTRQTITSIDSNHADDTFLRLLVGPPTISGVSPTALTAGTAPTITVTGSGFAANALPVVDGQGVSVSNVVVNPPGTQLTFTLTVAASGASGRHDIWVRNPGNLTMPYAGAASGRTGLLRVT